jgi:inner membrane protein
MDLIVQFLQTLTPWHWFVLGGVFLVVEIFAPTFYLIWTGLAALITGAVLWFVPGLDWPYQLTLFGALSLVTTWIWVTVYKAMPRGEGDRKRLNQRASRYVGRRAIVAEAFRAGRGPILLDDTRWQAAAEHGGEIPAGATVEITGTDGATLRVRRAG